MCVDFDHVIHDAAHPCTGRRMGGPMVGAKDALRLLEGEGYDIVVLTANRTAHIHDWLEFYSFPPYEVTNTKPPAVAYIDDKGIRFTTWRDCLQQLYDLTH